MFSLYNVFSLDLGNMKRESAEEGERERGRERDFHYGHCFLINSPSLPPPLSLPPSLPLSLSPPLERASRRGCKEQCCKERGYFSLSSFSFLGICHESVTDASSPPPYALLVLLALNIARISIRAKCVAKCARPDRFERVSACENNVEKSVCANTVKECGEASACILLRGPRGCAEPHLSQ